MADLRNWLAAALVPSLLFAPTSVFGRGGHGGHGHGTGGGPTQNGDAGLTTQVYRQPGDPTNVKAFLFICTGDGMNVVADYRKNVISLNGKDHPAHGKKRFETDDGELTFVYFKVFKTLSFQLFEAGHEHDLTCRQG